MYECQAGSRVLGQDLEVQGPGRLGPWDVPGNPHRVAMGWAQGQEGLQALRSKSLAHVKDEAGEPDLITELRDLEQLVRCPEPQFPHLLNRIGAHTHCLSLCASHLL